MAIPVTSNYHIPKFWDDEFKTLDYIVPYQNTTLILNNERLRISGLLFDIDDQILKILID